MTIEESTACSAMHEDPGIDSQCRAEREDDHVQDGEDEGKEPRPPPPFEQSIRDQEMNERDR